MSDISDMGVELRAQPADIRAVPCDGAGSGLEQSTERAQQGGLAAAVGATHLEQRLRRHVEREVGDQPAPAAHAFEVADAKHRSLRYRRHPGRCAWGQLYVCD